nr:hypothetical transcript [Hymenolepis microstoma]
MSYQSTTLGGVLPAIKNVKLKPLFWFDHASQLEYRFQSSGKRIKMFRVEVGNGQRERERSFFRYSDVVEVSGCIVDEVMIDREGENHQVSCVVGELSRCQASDCFSAERNGVGLRRSLQDCQFVAD